MSSGVAITLGAFNPLPNAAVIGVMVVAARSDHRDKGFFVFKGGWEYVVVLSAVAAALAGLGNGRWSVDHLIGNRRRGWKAAFGAAAWGSRTARCCWPPPSSTTVSPRRCPQLLPLRPMADAGTGRGHQDRPLIRRA